MTTPVNTATTPTIPIRRLVFASVVIGTMLMAGTGAVGTGIWLALSANCAGAALGTIALVVAPAVTIIGTLSTVLVNLLQVEKP